MSGKYLVDTGEQSVSAAQDLIEISGPADAVIKIRTVTVSQSSDAGDAQSEQLNVALKRGVGSTSGSGGASVTPGQKQTGDAAAGSTCERNNTTQAVAGGGSLTTLYNEDFNVMAGLSKTFPPGEEIILSPGEEFYVSVTAPGDALTMSCVVEFEEVGG